MVGIALVIYIITILTFINGIFWLGNRQSAQYHRYSQLAQQEARNNNTVRGRRRRR